MSISSIEQVVSTLTDEEYLNQQSNKEILASIFLGILRYIPVKERYDKSKIEEELQKKLKFKSITDPKLFRGCIDLLEDTEYAIKEYQEFGLGDSGRIGERYLRLYGILNSIYQQIFVSIELIDLFNYPNKNEILASLKSLKVYDLRNKLAAHTINFKLSSKVNRDFFQLAQATLRGWGEDILIVSNQNHSEKINLPSVVTEYINYSDTLLIAVCKKALKSLFPNHSEKREWLMFRFRHLEDRMG